MIKDSFFWTELLTWYIENGCHQFPWRNTKDAYHVLIAEFLLQQTPVRKVEEVYSQLLLNHPSISELVKANTLSLEAIIAQIDTNVIRLFTRYFGYTSKNSRPGMDKELASKIRSHFEGVETARAANLAVIDLAGLVCTAKNPHSTDCPLSRSYLDFLSRESESH